MFIMFDFDNRDIVREKSDAVLISVDPLHAFWLSKSLILWLPEPESYRGYIPDTMMVYDADTHEPIAKQYLKSHLITLG